MKNYKPFYEAETVKILPRLWGKSFLRGIYRNIETFAFKVLQ